MFLTQAHDVLLAAPHYEALHLLRTIRHAVEAVLLIVFIVGLALGFVIGRAVGRRR